MPTITRSQAEVLRLIAEVFRIPRSRATGVFNPRLGEDQRATLFGLGIRDDADANARVQAVGMYRDGRVDVR